MKITEKVKLDYNGLIEHGPITIVAFGDSVTHGYLAKDEVDYETAYWNRLKKMINARFPYVPVNVINAGIGGISAAASLGRLDSQVLKHEPDLVIVCFGLNDIFGSLESYLDSLRVIFERVKASGSDVIFMTPNMLNTRVDENTDADFVETAILTAEKQTSGRMDEYMSAAVALARELGVTVCDCYAQWKKISETQDVTALLANKINHPTREMHVLFAESLFRAIFGFSPNQN